MKNADGSGRQQTKGEIRERSPAAIQQGELVKPPGMSDADWQLELQKQGTAAPTAVAEHEQASALDKDVGGTGTSGSGGFDPSS